MGCCRDGDRREDRPRDHPKAQGAGRGGDNRISAQQGRLLVWSSHTAHGFTEKEKKGEDREAQAPQAHARKSSQEAFALQVVRDTLSSMSGKGRFEACRSQNSAGLPPCGGCGLCTGGPCGAWRRSRCAAADAVQTSSRARSQRSAQGGRFGLVR